MASLDLLVTPAHRGCQGRKAQLDLPVKMDYPAKMDRLGKKDRLVGKERTDIQAKSDHQGLQVQEGKMDHPAKMDHLGKKGPREKMAKMDDLDRQVRTGKMDFLGRMGRTELLDSPVILANKVHPDRLGKRVFAGPPEKRDLVDPPGERVRKALLGKLELQDKMGNPGSQDLPALQVLQENPRGTVRNHSTLRPPTLISTDTDHTIITLRTAPPRATAGTNIARRNLIAARKGSTEDESQKRKVITRVQEMIQVRIPIEIHITDERAKSTNIIVDDVRKTHLTPRTGRRRTVISPRPRVLERIGLKDTARLTGI
jgi:hypothetical protein